jgi:hypothetical protein
VSGLPAGDYGRQAGPAEVPALWCELAAIFLARADGRSQQLRPRIADSLRQHLAQLSLSLRRFAREGFVPYAHEWYMGMPKGVLNPRSILSICRQTSPLP